MKGNSLYNRNRCQGAGVLPISTDFFGDLWIHLGRENMNRKCSHAGTWCDFGGTTKAKDSLIDASRELLEESIGTIFNTLDQCETVQHVKKSTICSISHAEQFGTTYHMYLVKVPWNPVSPVVFCSKLGECHKQYPNLPNHLFHRHTNKVKRVFMEKDGVLLVKLFVLHDYIQYALKSRFGGQITKFTFFISPGNYKTCSCNTHNFLNGVHIKLRPEFATLLCQNWSQITSALHRHGLLTHNSQQAPRSTP